MSFDHDFRDHKVSDPAKVPTEPHWVIIRYVSVNIDTGWEDSSPTTVAEHYVFTDRATWTAAIKSLVIVKPHSAAEKFVAYEAPKRAKIETALVVTF
jgi:hypothetical protein